MENNRPYFKNLDVLRFFAASLVLFGHCVSDGMQYLQLPVVFTKLLKFISTGGHWVSLFFVLSGFLIGFLSLKDLNANRFSFKKFIFRRVLRIWPLYFLMLFIGYYLIPFLANIISNKVFVYDNLWQFVCFIGNFAVMKMLALGDFSLVPGSSAILWSVAIEEQFYILLALIVIISPKKYLIGVYSLLCLVGMVYILYFAPSQPGADKHSLYYLFDFFFGGLFGIFYTTKSNLPPSLNSKVKRIKLGLFVLFFALLFYNLKIGLVGLYALLILYLLNTDKGLGKFLSKQKLLQHGGKISYGIYVFHPLLQYSIQKIILIVWPSSSIFIKDILVLSITFPLTLVVAQLSYRYFESPFLRLKAKFY